MQKIWFYFYSIFDKPMSMNMEWTKKNAFAKHHIQDDCEKSILKSEKIHILQTWKTSVLFWTLELWGTACPNFMVSRVRNNPPKGWL